MPTNLHPLIRYRTIDRCLMQNDRQWTWETLAEACSETIREMMGEDVEPPSRRTIMEDIKFMRSEPPGFNAPILWDRRARSYRYADPDYSLFHLPISSRDLQELHHALAILRQFRGFRQVSGMEEIVSRLELALRRDPHHPETTVQFEPNLVATGVERLDLLYEATSERRCLRLTYQPFTEEEPYQRTVSPHLLKEYNNRWFLIGYDHSEHLIRNFALDRIRHAEIHLLSEYYRHPAFHPDRYFRDIIGVSIPDEDKEVVEVHLWASPAQAKYILTKPLHGSQQVLERNAQGTVFTYLLILNYELESRILSMGEEVEVLAPEVLRNRLRERVAGMQQRYGE